MPKATVWVEHNRATGDYVVYRGQRTRPAAYIGRCDRKDDAERLAASVRAVPTSETHPRLFGIIDGYPDPLVMTDEERAAACGACGGDRSLPCRYCDDTGLRSVGHRQEGTA